MAAGTRRSIKCNMCKKTIRNVVVITKHMWEAHREHMMKLRQKGMVKAKRKLSPAAQAASTLTWPERNAEMLEKAERKRHNLQKMMNRRAHTRFTYDARDNKLVVVVHQGVNKIELSNVTRVDVLE